MIGVGKNWRIWSKIEKEFEILGYTNPGGCHTEDAIKALKTLSKHIKKPIPGDIQIQLLSCDQ